MYHVFVEFKFLQLIRSEQTSIYFWFD